LCKATIPAKSFSEFGLYCKVVVNENALCIWRWNNVEVGFISFIVVAKGLICNPFFDVEMNASRAPLKPIQRLSNFSEVKFSVNVKLPLGKKPSLPVLFSTPLGNLSFGSIGIKPFSNTGNSPDQSTGKIKVSRPVFTLFSSFGRTAKKTP